MVRNVVVRKGLVQVDWLFELDLIIAWCYPISGLFSFAVDVVESAGSLTIRAISVHLSLLIGSWKLSFVFSLRI